MVVLQSFPFPPRIITDCQSILATMKAGAAVAINHSRVLARIWTSISAALEGSFEEFVASEKLVWMPAHQTIQGVGERRKSDGSKLTMVDCRANRLVEALAKIGPERWQTDGSIWKMVDAATALLKHRAAQLGAITHIANNCPDLQVNDKGEQVTK